MSELTAEKTCHFYRLEKPGFIFSGQGELCSREDFISLLEHFKISQVNTYRRNRVNTKQQNNTVRIYQFEENVM